MNGHGGDWTGYEVQFGKNLLDFSANTSPLGISEGVRQAVIQSLDHADRYPDPECRKLKKALSEKIGVPEINILCGSGASDLIERLVQALKPEKAIVTAPTFSEYAAALQRAGCKVYEHSLLESEGFCLTERILPEIQPDVDLLILCEPNNPTGLMTDPVLLKRILEQCRQCCCMLAIDECFSDFLPEKEINRMKNELQNGGLFLLRAFTKFYGMAGLRLGYCLGEQKLLEKMANSGPCWSVSTPAQAAGIAALSENDYAHILKKLIFEQRTYMKDELKKLGFQIIPGKANYLLFKSKDADLQEKLLNKGIMIRSCANFSGLDKHWFRIAIRTRLENERLLSALKEVL